MVLTLHGATTSYNTFPLSDAHVSIRFTDGTTFEELTDSDKSIPTEMFRFRNYDQLLALANTNRHLPRMLLIFYIWRLPKMWSYYSLNLSWKLTRYSWWVNCYQEHNQWWSTWFSACHAYTTYRKKLRCRLYWTQSHGRWDICRRNRIGCEVCMFDGFWCQWSSSTKGTLGLWRRCA